MREKWWWSDVSLRRPLEWAKNRHKRETERRVTLFKLMRGKRREVDPRQKVPKITSRPSQTRGIVLIKRVLQTSLYFFSLRLFIMLDY